jgi:hypothetical protein
MFIKPKATQLPPSSTGIQSTLSEVEIINFLRSLLEERGTWYAFWEADVSHLTNAQADRARAKSRRYIDSPRLKEYLAIQKLELEYSTRKRDGILTAYARIK